MADQTQQVADELLSRAARLEAHLLERSHVARFASDHLHLLGCALTGLVAKYLPVARKLVLWAEHLSLQSRESVQARYGRGSSIMMSLGANGG